MRSVGRRTGPLAVVVLFAQLGLVACGDERTSGRDEARPKVTEEEVTQPSVTTAPPTLSSIQDDPLQRLWVAGPVSGVLGLDDEPANVVGVGDSGVDRPVMAVVVRPDDPVEPLDVVLPDGSVLTRASRFYGVASIRGIPTVMAAIIDPTRESSLASGRSQTFLRLLPLDGSATTDVELFGWESGPVSIAVRNDRFVVASASEACFGVEELDLAGEPISDLPLVDFVCGEASVDAVGVGPADNTSVAWSDGSRTRVDVVAPDRTVVTSISLEGTEPVLDIATEGDVIVVLRQGALTTILDGQIRTTVSVPDDVVSIALRIT